MSRNKALAVAGLVLAIVSFVVPGYPWLTLAVICVALALVL